MRQSVRQRYFKPRSLTWWASLMPLIAGSISATEPLHQWHDIVTSIHNASGGMSPAALINVGLIGIGLRGAIND